jgi:hypothetical protein
MWICFVVLLISFFFIIRSYYFSSSPCCALPFLFVGCLCKFQRFFCWVLLLLFGAFLLCVPIVFCHFFATCFLHLLVWVNVAHMCLHAMHYSSWLWILVVHQCFLTMWSCCSSNFPCCLLAPPCCVLLLFINTSLLCALGAHQCFLVVLCTLVVCWCFLNMRFWCLSNMLLCY